MSLVEELKHEVALNAKERLSSEEFVRLSAFYEEMKRLGFSKKQEYELPLIDTVGRSIYNRNLGIKTKP